MAEDEQEHKEVAKPKKGKKKLIIIGIVAVVTIGGLYFALFAKSKKVAATDEDGIEIEEGEEGEVEGEGGEEAKIHMFPIETMIVNLSDRGSFLKVTIELSVETEEDVKELTEKLPKIKDSLISVLGARTSDQILKPDGRDVLKTELKEALNTALKSEIITDLFFTEFIIQ